MNYSHQTDRYTATTTTGDTTQQQLVMLFGSASLHQVHVDLEELQSISGSGAGTLAHPLVAVMPTLVLSWATGSTKRALALLADEPTWQVCRRAYRDRSGIDLPMRPPSRNQVSYFASCLTRLDPEGVAQHRERLHNRKTA